MPLKAWTCIVFEKRLSLLVYVVPCTSKLGADARVTTLSSITNSFTPFISPSHNVITTNRFSFVLPEVSTKTKVPPIRLSPYTIGMGSLLLTLFNLTP